MTFTETAIPGAYVVDLQPMADRRGWFSRFYCKDEFKEIGFRDEWLQMNHSYTQKLGSIRGIHFQSPPHSETKLIRCVRGKVFDVMVDIRMESPTFLKWIGIELSAENKRSLLVPEGVAHGFQTLEDDCELIYCHSNFFVKSAEGGLRFNDPAINIIWPLPPSEVSERDSHHNLIDNTFIGLKL